MQGTCFDQEIDQEATTMELKQNLTGQTKSNVDEEKLVYKGTLSH
jgi:hypothetical protein